jgi:hypothetical protein
MNPLIIYAETIKRAESWRGAHVKSVTRAPLFASPETPNVFRGLRNMTIIVVGTPPIVYTLMYCEGRNNIIFVEED